RIDRLQREIHVAGRRSGDDDGVDALERILVTLAGVDGWEGAPQVRKSVGAGVHRHDTLDRGQRLQHAHVLRSPVPASENRDPHRSSRIPWHRSSLITPTVLRTAAPSSPTWPAPADP